MNPAISWFKKSFYWLFLFFCLSFVWDVNFVNAIPPCDDVDLDGVCNYEDNCIGSGSTGVSGVVYEYLYDESDYDAGQGFRYDPNDGGELNDGSDDAYDSMYFLQVNDDQYTGSFVAFEENDREFVFDEQVIDDLVVSRKLMVPTVINGFGRYLNIFHNPTASPITVDVRVYGNLGSNGQTKVRRTSSGDKVLTTDDYWAVTDDDTDGGNDPSLGHIWDGEGGTERIDYVLRDGDNFEFGWNSITIDPGETKIIMFFAIQQNTRNEVLQKIFKITNNVFDWPVTLGMTDAEISAVQNWSIVTTCNADQTDNDGDGVGNPCDRCEGSTDADDSDGDGLPDGCDDIVGYYDFPAYSIAPAVLLKDIRSGGLNSDPDSLTLFQDDIYFVANDGIHGNELWKTDGTEAGTVMVKDIVSGANGSEPYNLVVSNGILFFVAYTDDYGYELWKTDGTEAGTIMVKDIYNGANGSGIYNTIAYGDGILFIADDSVSTYELWKSDGTEAGTVLVKDVNPGVDSSWIEYFTLVNDVMYFRALTVANGYELWKTDGTEAGTVLVKDILPGVDSGDPYEMVAYGDLLIFNANNGVDGYELWKTDGTEAGTVLVKDIEPGADGSYPSNFKVYEGNVYFNSYTTDNGYELWKTDGTEAGTVFVKDILAGSDSGDPRNFIIYDDTLFFTAYTDDLGNELWKTDGTEAGTVLVKDIYVGDNSSDIDYLSVIDGYLYFQANDGIYGEEIWKSDGTTAGTVRVTDIMEGDGDSNPRYFKSFQNTVFFRAASEDYGRELYYLSSSEETIYTLTYSAGAGGTITGSTSQSVASGANGTAVRAVPNAGHRFVRWSDNLTTNPRTDTNVTGDITVSAVFERVESGGGGGFSAPGGTGTGFRDAFIIGAQGIGLDMHVGQITPDGVNVLTYITNNNYFNAPESGNDWNWGSHSFTITELDLYNYIVTLLFQSEPTQVILKKGETKSVDLDKDGVDDVNATFVGTYINRAEITIKALSKATETDTVKEVQIETKQGSFAYGKARLTSLAEEQGKAKELADFLTKTFGKKVYNNLFWNNIGKSKQWWYGYVNAYVYGGYTFEEITQSVKFGGKTVHPIISAPAWRNSADYKDYIGR